MPELPDVETVRRYLVSADLIGAMFSGAEILWPKAIRVPDSEDFTQCVTGSTIVDVRRRAKFLVIDLLKERPQVLILHLRMTGSLHLLPVESEQPRHTRNTFFLEDGRKLCFVDPRKLGMIWLTYDEMEVLDGLGPEPLSADFTGQALIDALAPLKRPIKAVLCDQHVVAGIGNLYADETLHDSGVHPLVRACDLLPDQVRAIHRAIVSRLTEAVEYLAPLYPRVWLPNVGEDGFDMFAVPRKQGAPCPRCGESICRTAVGGRGTYYCPGCQQ